MAHRTQLSHGPPSMHFQLPTLKDASSSGCLLLVFHPINHSAFIRTVISITPMPCCSSSIQTRISPSQPVLPHRNKPTIRTPRFPISPHELHGPVHRAIRRPPARIRHPLPFPSSPRPKSDMRIQRHENPTRGRNRLYDDSDPASSRATPHLLGLRRSIAPRHLLSRRSPLGSAPDMACSAVPHSGEYKSRCNAQQRDDDETEQRDSRRGQRRDPMGPFRFRRLRRGRASVG